MLIKFFLTNSNLTFDSNWQIYFLLKHFKTPWCQFCTNMPKISDLWCLGKPEVNNVFVAPWFKPFLHMLLILQCGIWIIGKLFCCCHFPTKARSVTFMSSFEIWIMYKKGEIDSMETQPKLFILILYLFILERKKSTANNIWMDNSRE